MQLFLFIVIKYSDFDFITVTLKSWLGKSKLSAPQMYLSGRFRVQMLEFPWLVSRYSLVWLLVD